MEINTPKADIAHIFYNRTVKGARVTTSHSLKEQRIKRICF